MRLGGDNPKLSTALKLVRLGYATRIHVRDIPPHSVVLNPFSQEILKPSDSTLLLNGVVVLDASWNSGLEELRNIARRRRYEQRVLPVLKAGNPINYGVLTKLSSVEAVAAALYITGFKKYSLEILSKFKWGLTFYELNKEYLEKYSRAESAEELIKIQNEILRSMGLYSDD
ncbi:MAG: DUF367 family protein [Desulfurococcaceae archaeon TW002]